MYLGKPHHIGDTYSDVLYYTHGIEDTLTLLYYTHCIGNTLTVLGKHSLYWRYIQLCITLTALEIHVLHCIILTVIGNTLTLLEIHTVVYCITLTVLYCIIVLESIIDLSLHRQLFV